MYDFDRVINRKGTGSVRWDNLPKKYNEPDLIPLTTADMDFPSAPQISQKLREIVDLGIYGYVGHTDAYYDAIIRRFRSHWNWEIKKEWIMHASTIISAIAYGIQYMTQPGDTVVIATPMYHPFQHLIKDNGRVLSESVMKQVNGRFEIDFADFEERLSKAKMLIFCNPHNPSGTVWKKDELKRVMELCVKYQVIVFSDEIHSDFVYEGNEFVSMAAAAQELGKAALDLLVVCSSGGKSYNMAGLQIANMVIPGEELRRIYQQVMTGIGFHELNLMGTQALTVAYNECDEWLEAVRQYLEGTRNMIIEYISKNIPEITPIVPEGTYMMFLDCRKLNRTDAELEDLFYHKAKIGVNIGNTFGAGGSGFIRINFASPRSTMLEALQRIKDAIDSRI